MSITTLSDDWRTWGPEDKARLLWRLTARPNQITPPGDWNVWLILAGRGWGKTRTGAQDVADYGMRFPNSRIAIVAPTIADARDTCVEGESGLLACLPAGDDVVLKWNRSMGELVLRNGTQYKIFSAEEPERLRGPQHHRAWCDELAAWKYLRETWDQLMFGLRLKGPDGSDPQAVATTTPKPLKFLKKLIKRTDVIITKGKTEENADNLSKAALTQLYHSYAGTRLGRQELDAEILDDVEGALWQMEMIDQDRILIPPTYDIRRFPREQDLLKVVVAVDPAITAKAGSDMTGIVVCAKDHNGHGYVLVDRSTVATPGVWAQRAINSYYDFLADRIVAESNQGGDLVKHTISNEDSRVPVKLVTATRGKILRAEPVSMLYEQHKIHHLGELPELEEQMVQFTAESTESPDRLDALVWGLTELFVGNTSVKNMGKINDTRLRGRR